MQRCDVTGCSASSSRQSFSPPLDTCPDKNGTDFGTDPTNNFMSYLYGDCKLNATKTAGQVRRMVQQYETFRINKRCRNKRVVCVSHAQCCHGLSCKREYGTKFYKTCH